MANDGGVGCAQGLAATQQRARCLGSMQLQSGQTPPHVINTRPAGSMTACCIAALQSDAKKAGRGCVAPACQFKRSQLHLRSWQVVELCHLYDVYSRLISADSDSIPVLCMHTGLTPLPATSSSSAYVCKVTKPVCQFEAEHNMCGAVLAGRACSPLCVTTMWLAVPGAGERGCVGHVL